MNQYVVLVVILAVGLFENVTASCKGCVELDSLTFDKMLDKFEYSIIKFDISYPYGPKHDEFEQFSKDAASQKELLVGVVGVKDYGEKDNQDIADRYGIKSEKFPGIVFFDRKNPDKPVHFTDTEYTADAYRRFVKANSNLVIGLAGCIQEFDVLARRLMEQVTDKAAAQKVVDEATTLLKSYAGKKDESVAKYYVAYSERIVERGVTFIDAEKQRLKKILNGKITDTKKADLRTRLNILESFAAPEGDNTKTEL